MKNGGRGSSKRRGEEDRSGEEDGNGEEAGREKDVGIEEKDERGEERRPSHGGERGKGS